MIKELRDNSLRFKLNVTEIQVNNHWILSEIQLKVNPLVTRATFVDRVSSNLQSRLKKVKIEFHFFNFFLNLHILRYLAFNFFVDFVFLMPFFYLWMNFYDIFTAYSSEPREFKSVEIFRISLSVSEILKKYFFRFFDLFAVKKILLKILRFLIFKKM